MAQISRDEVLCRGIMVDVEAGGRNPVWYPLLSIGAVHIGNPSRRFYVELKPDMWNFNPEALATCKLDPERLWKDGAWPKEALKAFIGFTLSCSKRPLFVAHNAAFDWMYVECYLGKYGLDNPYGYWPFDTKSAYGNIMLTPLPHHAGEDAFIQTHDLLRHYEKSAA